MLPLFAITYTATRLGLEAQSAAAFRLLRLGAGITKSADQIVPESPIPPADIAPAPVAAAPKRRYTAKKVHRKSAPVGGPSVTYTRKASAAGVPSQLECFGWFLLPVADKGRASTTQRWPRLPEAVLARRLHLRLALLQGTT